MNQSQPSRQQWVHTLCEPIITQLLITDTDDAIQCAVATQVAVAKLFMTFARSLVPDSAGRV